MLNFKPDKLKSRLLLMRWAVLGALVLAVGAVAVWGGARPAQTAGVANIIQSRLAQTPTDGPGKLAEQLQAHIGEDTQPVLPAAAELKEYQPEPAAETTENDADINETSNAAIENAGDDTGNNAGNNTGDDTDNFDVVDEAPEPWVGDELLTVEANLQQLLPPLSGMLQGSNGILRNFGYGYDEVFNDYRFHGAVDLAGSLGAAVIAPLAGTVLEIKQDSFYGDSVVLEHDGKLQTSYFGLTLQPGLQIGQQLIAGEKLGELCAPPPFESNQTPHLHWEISLDGQLLNPADYF